MIRIEGISVVAQRLKEAPTEPKKIVMNIEEPENPTLEVSEEELEDILCAVL